VRPDIVSPMGTLAAFCSVLTAARYVVMLNVLHHVACPADFGIAYGLRCTRGAVVRCAFCSVPQYEEQCLNGW
jgi:hypothetical protein